MYDSLIRQAPSKIDRLNNSDPCTTDSPGKPNNFSEQDYSKNSVQQGRSPFGARSVRSVREHGTRARTPLAAFFNSPKIILRWLGAFCLLSLIFWPTVGMGYTDRIVAIVNKEVITWFDLEDETRDEYSRLKAKFSGEELERRYTQKQREVLNDLIVERLQLQEAKSKGLSVTQDEIDATLRRTPLPATQTEEEFGQQLLLKKLFDFSVRRNVVIEEEELRRYYNANPTLFHTPPEYQLKHIFFEASKEDDRTRARAKAQAIYEDWLPEIALKDLAAQHAQSVRELGWVQEKDLLTPLEHALQEMIPGTLSRPIETPTGVHLLLYDDVKKPQPHLFERVERDIRAKLLKERGEEAYNEWMNKLKQQAFIDIKL